MPNPFDALANAAYHLLNGLATLTEPLFGTAAAAGAIILGTVLMRALLVPAGYAQHRAEQRRTALTARVAELRERYRTKPRRLETELTALYRAESGGLLRGLLPMLVQAPVFAGLYRLFASPTIGGHANTLLHQSLFGVPLGAHLLAATAPQLLVFGGLLALLAALGFASSRLLRPAGPRPTGALGLVTRVVPYAPLAAAMVLPLAGSLFLVTTTVWTIAQTVILRGRY